MIKMELLPEIFELIMENIPAIATIIIGVLATRFLLWRKFKRVLALISILLVDLDTALEDDAFSVKECQTLSKDIILIIKEVYDTHKVPD